MNGSNQRRHPRLMHHARIKLVLPVLSQVYILEMKDFSESGLFLLSAETSMPEVGAIVEVQTTEFEDAPVQTAKVVRVEAGVGFAVEFIWDASSSDV